MAGEAIRTGVCLREMFELELVGLLSHGNKSSPRRSNSYHRLR